MRHPVFNNKTPFKISTKNFDHASSRSIEYQVQNKLLPVKAFKSFVKQQENKNAEYKNELIDLCRM